MLDLEDDAARANWGGEWHMPTKEQCDELFNTEYVTGELVDNYNDSGINGYLLTSVSNGNTIFIPAICIYADGELDDRDRVRIWSSSIGADDFKCGQILFFGPLGGKINKCERHIGMPVRGVIEGSEEGPLK